MNRLFVAYKPSRMSSNALLGRLKRKYKQKKAGYSGTLDPFAKGVLIVAFGAHTKLFRFLNKTPKRYRATLWLGAASDTLDIEGVTRIDTIDELPLETVSDAVEALKGTHTYLPPKYSAKKIAGKRAYELARAGEEVALKKITSKVYESRLLHYRHPFVTFEVSVSEGTYVRSLGEMLAHALHVKHGALSALERLSEGDFRYNNEKALDITQLLAIQRNGYNGDINDFHDGKRLRSEDFTDGRDGIYWVDIGDAISIVEISEKSVRYLTNKVEKC